MSRSEFHEVELQTRRQIEEAIQAAQERPITQDEAALLRWASGIQINHATKGSNHDSH